MTRKFPLSKPGLDAATERTLEYLKLHNLPKWHAASLTRDVLVAYFEGRKQDETLGRNWSQTTWLLANMVEGQMQHFTGSSLQLLRQRFPSARNLAGNQMMMWRCESLETGEVRVTRMTDGSPVKRNPLANPKVREIVMIEPGEAIVSKTVKSTRGRGYLGSNSKVMARRWLNDLNAQWIVYREKGKIMIRRTR